MAKEKQIEKVVETEKMSKVNALLQSINKEFGKGTIGKLGDSSFEETKCYSTGSLLVDNALGIGGIPQGRMIEIFGPESSGKTTLTLQTIASVQKAGGIAAFIDAENALDRKYAKQLGCNVDDLIISQPDNAEQALELVDKLTTSGLINLIVIDSVAALTPKVEIDGDMDDMQVGVLARLMSKALRKLTAIANKTNTTIIFINQLRDIIGSMGYGPKETTTGGKALKFFASVRLDIRRVESIKKGDAIIGNKVKIKVVKNKVAPPFKTAETEIYFGEGISITSEVLTLALKFNIVDKVGGWHSYGERKLGNGRENIIKLFKDEPTLYEEIKSKVMEKIVGVDEVLLGDVTSEDATDE